MNIPAISTPHTSTAFDADLIEVRRIVADMAGRAERALRASVDALAGMDRDGAAVIVAADRDIDALNEQLERSVVRTLALRAPMADDLRELIVAIRLGSQLERAGDQAKGIARRVPAVDPEFCARFEPLLARMTELAAGMIADANAAFQSRDVALARSVRRRDRALNALFDELTAALIGRMSEEPRRVTAGSHLLSIGKQIERVGDYATKIADNVCYMVTGEHFADWRDGPALAPVG